MMKAGASPAFIPQNLSQSGPTSPVVDEPIGARSSLGLTLWHMGHDTQKIDEFHQFLKARKLDVEKLVPSKTQVPAQSQRILLEPERLSSDKLNGWQAQGPYLVSGAPDVGPEVEIPLHIERVGLYRGWVRFYGWPNGTGIMGLRIYRAGHEADGPLVNDQIYDHSTPKEGPTWQSFLVDLPAGDYSVHLCHVTRSQQAGDGGTGYMPRQIDALYFTDEIWKDAPSESDLESLRKTAPPTNLQITAKPVLSSADRAQWRQWQIRPLSWEESLSQPRLFALSRTFWRQQIDAIGAQDYGAKVPDYRDPTRQVVFDDIWNFSANPVQIKRRIDTLKGDLITSPSPYFSYWLQAGDFEHVEGGWEKSGTGLSAGYGDFAGLASTDLPVAQPGEYAVWVRSGNNGYYAPWRLKASNEAGQTVTFDHIESKYDSEWQKVGVLRVDKAGAVHFELTPLPYRNPGTYRYIYDILLTTDLNYLPQGTVRPPLTLAQYNARALATGATEEDAYLMWLSKDAYTPLPQEVWDKNSWPPSPTKAASTKEVPTRDLERKVVLTVDSQRAVQIGLRSLRGEPIRLTLSGDNLRGVAGNFAGKVSWRVEGFVPTSESSRDWSPFLLLRRPWVTVPPRSVAGVWLTLDSTGVPPGNYTAEIAFQSAGLPKRKVKLQVQVTAAVTPKATILVGGYTLPPEGESYTRDYVKHGMNIWYGEMSKANMRRYGIKLLALNIGETDSTVVAARIKRLQEMGLEYDDWVFTVLDEPSGDSEEKLKPYLDVAKAIRKADPKARICFNPSEAATLATFKILEPWCDVWQPYAVHLVFPPREKQAKIDLFTSKPWLWYTTPCLWDKNATYPAQIYQQIRSVPEQSGNVIGTTFFAFYYPFRDAWDTAHETMPDAGVTVLPSRHGPVTTRPWEAIREASQVANLAQAVKEKWGTRSTTPAGQKLVREGTTADLVAALK